VGETLREPSTLNDPWMYQGPAAIVSITPPSLYTGALTLCSRSTLAPEPPSLSNPATLSRASNAAKGVTILATVLFRKLEGAKNGSLPSFKAAV